MRQSQADAAATPRRQGFPHRAAGRGVAPARPRPLLTTALLWAALCPVPAYGVAPPAGGPPRDRYGDPLPPGAKARLGTLRLRHALTWGSAHCQLIFSPDGRVLLTRGETGIRLWEVANGRPLGWMSPRPGPSAARLLPDGKTLVTAELRSARGPGRFETSWVVRRWRWGTGEPLGRVEFPAGSGPGENRLAMLSPDGKLLVSWGYGGRPVTLWDAVAGRRLRQLDRGVGGVTALALTPDGRQLVFLSGGVYLYDTATGKQVRELAAGGTGGGLAFSAYYFPEVSPDGRLLVLSGPRELHLWDLRSGKHLARRDGVRGPVAFSPGGDRLACSGHRAIHLLQTRTLKVIRAFEPHDENRGTYALAFSPDGKRLALGGEFSISLWDVATGKRLNDPAGHLSVVHSLRFSPDGRLLASGGQDGAALVWDVATRRAKHRFRGHYLAVLGLGFSPDGRLLATGDGQPAYGTDSREAQVRLWDLGRGRLRRQWYGHLSAVRDLDFSPDGKLLASAGGDDRARLWEAATGKRLRQVREVAGCKSAGFSPGRKTVLVHGSAGDLFLWEVATGKKALSFREFRGDYGRGLVLARWLGDGRRVAGAGPGGLRFWDAASGKELRAVRVPAHPSGADAFALSPDGKTFAAREGSGGDDAVGLWDADTGECFARLRGHTGPVSALAFSPDSGTLASGGYDTTVLLWDVGRLRLGHLLGKALAGHEGAIRGLAADPAKAAAFLQGRLERAAKAEARAAGLIKELDSDDFATRERATRGLVRLGPEAVFPLRAALEGRPSPEARSRLRRALGELERAGGADPALDPGWVRAALSLLETLGTPQARRAIEELAAGPKGAMVTREAAAAVGRLKGRGGR
jgi:WD40 repeat protein